MNGCKFPLPLQNICWKLNVSKYTRMHNRLFSYSAYYPECCLIKAHSSEFIPAQQFRLSIYFTLNYTIQHITMSSSRRTIQRPSRDSPDYALSPTAVTHQFPGSATSSPSFEDDFYGPSRINERRNFGPSVTVGGSTRTSSPSRQVPSGLLMPDFWSHT